MGAHFPSGPRCLDVRGEHEPCVLRAVCGAPSGLGACAAAPPPPVEPLDPGLVPSRLLSSHQDHQLPLTPWPGSERPRASTPAHSLALRVLLRSHGAPPPQFPGIQAFQP